MADCMILRFFVTLVVLLLALLRAIRSRGAGLGPRPLDPPQVAGASASAEDHARRLDAVELRVRGRGWGKTLFHTRNID